MLIGRLRNALEEAYPSEARQSSQGNDLLIKCPKVWSSKAQEKSKNHSLEYQRRELLTSFTKKQTKAAFRCNEQ